GQGSLHVHLQRRETWIAPAREPEALDGPTRRVFRLLLQGRAEAGVDGKRRAVSREGEARRLGVLQEEHGREVGAQLVRSKHRATTSRRCTRTYNPPRSSP